MRRLLSSVVLGLALLCAGISWAAFTTRSTVFDPARSERIAGVLVDSPVVRDAAAEAVSSALEQALPAEAMVSSAEIDLAAQGALADPRATGALSAAIVGAHRRLMGEAGTEELTLDAGPVAQAGRDALIAARPDLAGVLPQAPPLQVALPTERLPELGGLREPLRLAVGLGGAVTTLLVALAFLLATDRPRVLSRMGRWALAAGLWWSIVGYGLPRLVSNVADDRIAVLGALGTAVSGPLLAPALALSLAGAGIMLGAHWWRKRLDAPTPTPAAGPAGSVSAPPVGARQADLDRGWDRRRPVYRRPQRDLDAAAGHYTGLGGNRSPYPGGDGYTSQDDGDATGVAAGRHAAHDRGIDL